MADALLPIAASPAITVVWDQASAGRRRSLPRNALLGVRTGSTTRSDTARYAAHEAATAFDALAGIWFLVGGLLAGLAGDSDGERAAILISAWAVGLVQRAVAVIVAERAARSVDHEEEPTCATNPS